MHRLVTPQGGGCGVVPAAALGGAGRAVPRGRGVRGCGHGAGWRPRAAAAVGASGRSQGNLLLPFFPVSSCSQLRMCVCLPRFWNELLWVLGFVWSFWELGKNYPPTHTHAFRFRFLTHAGGAVQALGSAGAAGCHVPPAHCAQPAEAPLQRHWRRRRQRRQWTWRWRWWRQRERPR